MKKHIHVYVMVLVIMLFQTPFLLAKFGEVTFYQLTYQSENLAGYISINGFKIIELNGKGSAGGAPLNIWLIGNNNLQIGLQKVDAEVPIKFLCGISELQQGEVVSSNEKGALISVELNESDFSKNENVSLLKKFKSTLDFKNHLSEGGKATEKEIIKYAKSVYKHFKSKNADWILKESELKIIDYSIAFGGADMKSELRRLLIEGVFEEKLNPLKPEELRVIGVGPNKAIWHVLNGKDELIKTNAMDGATSEIPIYIGFINGRFQIVR